MSLKAEVTPVRPIGLEGVQIQSIGAGGIHAMAMDSNGSMLGPMAEKNLSVLLRSPVPRPTRGLRLHTVAMLLALCLGASPVSASETSSPPTIHGHLITPLSGDPVVRTRNGNAWVFEPGGAQFKLQLQDKQGKPLHPDWGLTSVDDLVMGKLPLGDDTLWLFESTSRTPQCVSLAHTQVISVPLGRDIDSLTLVDGGGDIGLGVAKLSTGGLRLFKLVGCVATPIPWNVMDSAQWQVEQLSFAPSLRGVTLFVRDPPSTRRSPDEVVSDVFSPWRHVVHVSFDDNTVRVVNVAARCAVTYWGVTGGDEKNHPYMHFSAPVENTNDALIHGWWRGHGALCYLKTPQDMGFIELPEQLETAEAILHPIDRQQAWVLFATSPDDQLLVLVDNTRRAWAEMSQMNVHVTLDHRATMRLLLDHGYYYWRASNIAFDHRGVWYFDTGYGSNSRRTTGGWSLVRVEHREGKLRRMPIAWGHDLRTLIGYGPREIYMHPHAEGAVWLSAAYMGDKRLLLVGSDGKTLADLPSSFRLDNILCFQDGICWMTSSAVRDQTVQFQRIDASSNAFSLEVSFGGDTFTLKNGPWTMTSMEDAKGRLHGELGWKWSNAVRSPSANEDSQAVFWLQQKAGEKVVQGRPNPVGFKSSLGFLLDGRSELDLKAPFELHVQYRDRLGSNIEVAWTDVRYDVPWYKHAFVVSALLALTAVAIGLLISVFSTSFLGRWLPLLFWILPLTGAPLQWLRQTTEIQVAGVSLPLHGGFLLGWTIVFVGLAMTAGLISPALFRHLARVEGIKWAAAAALKSASARRHLFQDYFQKVSAQLRDARKIAADEQYHSLPAELESGKLAGVVTVGSSPEKTLLSNPAEHILRLIQERNNPAPILWIEGPGGRGKSALLREIVDRLLREFEATGACPLPVLLPADKRLVMKDLEETLARFAPTPELLANQVRDGDFLVVIDGLSELEPDLKALRDFLETEEGAACPILITAQPREDLRRVLRGSPRFVRILPQPLNADTVSAFINTYERGATLSPEQLDACGSREGYMPLLVRWMVRYRAQALTRADLYSAFCAELLSRIPAEKTRREALYTLCLREYWERGQTQFRCDDTNREACEARVRAGLMVAVKRNLANHSLVDVRFFHDSMMSYLTAEALRHDEKLRWISLPRAAGHAHFRKRQQGSRTELFQMMIDTYGLSTLAPRLEQWLGEQVRTLDARRQDVVEALPEHLRDLMRTDDQWTQGAGPLLRSAIAHCQGDPEALATLFSGIARLISD